MLHGMPHTQPSWCWSRAWCGITDSLCL